MACNPSVVPIMVANNEDIADIDAQIAALQAARAKTLARAAEAKRVEEAEKAKILVGSTPVKAKGKEPIASLSPGRPAQPIFIKNDRPQARPSSTRPRQILPEIPLRPPPSNMSFLLAGLRKSSSTQADQKAPVPRSSTFADRPAHSSMANRSVASSSGDRQDDGDLEVGPRSERPEVKRDNDALTVVETLTLGPKEVGKDPEGEDEWRNVEPNSGIRLAKRLLSHQAVQDYIYGRYYISPSQLYSVIRLSKDGTTYEVPVEGDWLTIAVVAERSDVKVSGAKQEVVSDLEDSDEDAAATGPSNPRKVPVNGKSAGARQGKGKDVKESNGLDEWKKKRGPRKYVNFRLCSLPPRSKGNSATGDSLLQLLLFQADHVVKADDPETSGDEAAEGKTKKVKRSYRGGSGGAYEKWCNLTVGSVIAILNPRVLRPLRAGSQAPHPLSLPLALNPISDQCISLIGHASDLGCCTAIQKDGNRCENWVDTRQSQVCEFHLFAAIKRNRASRSEFTASTSVFALTTAGGAPTKRNPTHIAGSFPGGGGKGVYDPRRKMGLLPAGGSQAAPRSIDNGGGGATYIVGGGLVRTSKEASIIPGFGEGFHRPSGSKKRSLEEKELDRSLKRILETDGPSGSVGARYSYEIQRKEREAKEKEKAKQRPKGEKDIGVPSAKGLATDEKLDKESSNEEDKKRPFSAITLRRIGYDPTNMTKVSQGDDTAKKLDAATALKDHANKTVKLGRPPGPKVRSVMAPAAAASLKPSAVANLKQPPAKASSGLTEAEGDVMIDLDDF